MIPCVAFSFVEWMFIKMGWSLDAALEVSKRIKCVYVSSKLLLM
jgi:hypothetical protein